VRPARPEEPVTFLPRPRAYWRFGPGRIDGKWYAQDMELSRSPGEFRERLTDPERWHKWEVTVTADRLLVRWDGRDLPPITTGEFENTRTRHVRAHADRLTVKQPRFTEPAFGPGLGLYVKFAEASYRNVRLVPLPRP
jgi:hypothetical protein